MPMICLLKKMSKVFPKSVANYDLGGYMESQSIKTCTQIYSKETNNF